MVFYTTASNTGTQTAACISLHSVLNQRPLGLRAEIMWVKLFWLMFGTLSIEISESLDISLFQRLNNNFHALTYNYKKDLNFTECPLDHEPAKIQYQLNMQQVS